MIGTENKRKAIIDVIYLIMIIAFIYIIVRYALGICLPFVLAFFFAIILQKPKNFLIKKTPLKKGAASAISVLVCVIVVAALIVLIGASVVSRIKDFIEYLGTIFSDWQTILDNVYKSIGELAEKLPSAVSGVVKENIDNIYNGLIKQLSSSAEIAEAGEKVKDVAAESSFSVSSLLGGISSLSSPFSRVAGAVSKIPSALIALVMSIVACCFMTADYEKIKHFIKSQFPENKRNDVSRAKYLLSSSLKKMGKAYGLIMLITFSEMCVGLYALKFIGIFDSSFIVPICIAIAIVDIIPVLGTGTVVIPWAVYSLIVSNYKMAIGLIVIYAIITVIRQIIEPKFVAGQLGLSPAVTITAMYFGLKVFGVLGMIVTPLLIIMLKLLNDEGIIHLWKTPPKKEFEDEEEKPKKLPSNKKSAVKKKVVKK